MRIRIQSQGFGGQNWKKQIYNEKNYFFTPTNDFQASGEASSHPERTFTASKHGISS
jgi:hypothetical protein